MINLKNLALGAGIVILFALVLWQGIEAFYPSPQYDDFCKPGRYETTPAKYPGPNVQCNYTDQMRQQEQQCYNEKGQPVYNYDENGCQAGVKECDYCSRDLEDAQKTHAQAVFYISVIIGILAFIVGFAILSIEPVGSALMFSGIWAFFYGTVVNWRNITNIWRFLLLLIALILVIYLAVRMNKNADKKK